MEDCEDCPMCRVSDLVEKHRRAGRRGRKPKALVLAGIEKELMRLALAENAHDMAKAMRDFEYDRGMAKMFLEMGPPVEFTLDLTRPPS